MASNQLQHGIGTFSSRQRAIQAFNELRKTGFPMQKISILAKNPDGNEQLGSADMDERAITPVEGARAGAVQGGMTGGLLALIGGLTVLMIPGFGPALAAESVLVTLLGSGASATAGGLVGALRGWFIPEEQAKFYHDRVFQRDYLVTVEGTETEIRCAESVLNSWGIREWRVYNASDNDA
jgi:hypothetical protein